METVGPVAQDTVSIFGVEDRMRETIPEDLKNLYDSIKQGRNCTIIPTQLIERIAAAEARNKMLEAELAVRTQSISFTCEIPTEYHGMNKGVYLSGWEEGFRKHAFNNPYTVQHHKIAYTHGFNDGAAEAQKRIDAALREDR